VKGFWEKCEKIVFFVLLFLLPTQLGKHFWFDWSLVWGMRVDYFSPTFYLVDMVWLIWVVLILVKNFKKERKKVKFEVFWVIILILVNILVANNRWVAGYKWLRLGQLFWVWSWVTENKRTVKNGLLKVIPWWLIVEGILAIGQVSKGGSLNGWWWFLGERKFDFNTIGIAQMSVVDMGLVRAYGTFSHPNSLAGFLLVSLIWWVKNFSLFRSSNYQRVKWWVVFWLGLVGIFLAGSRTIWLLTLGFLIFLGWNSKVNIKKKVKGLAFLVLLVIVLIKMIGFNYPLVNFLGGWDENGLIKRGQLNLAALQMIKKSPWFGVGLGNFLANLPEFQKNNQIFWFQPVHNVLLLLVSEIGLLGFGVMGWVLGRKWDWKKWDKWIWIILGVIFVSGMVDHYWFTLPQNMWLLTLVFGII
jgi:hypothetical protein